MPSKTTQFDLLRHGRVSGPPALYGSTDIALSEEGWAQMRQQNIGSPDIIISSPLKRCYDFAHVCATDRALQLQVEPNLQECDFGKWDGVPFDNLGEQWPLLESFWEDPSSHTPPQGETLQDFHNRVKSSWYSLLNLCAGKHSLIVCHGGVIRMILAHLLPVDWRTGSWFSRLQIGYGSLTRISIPLNPQAYPVINFIGLPTPYEGEK